MTHTHSENLPPMKIPAGTAISLETLYPIPAKDWPLNINQADITPPGLKPVQA